MSDFDNTNRGSIWKNDDKKTDTHPDFKGTINVEGIEYWLSGWKRKEGANPKAPALSLSIQKKEATQQTASAPQNTAPAIAGEYLKKGSMDDFSDDIPFFRPHDEYFG